MLSASFASTETGCQAVIVASGGADANVLDDRAPSTFECALNVTAADYTFAEDAVVNATLSSAVYACEEPSDTQSNITARVRFPPSSMGPLLPCHDRAVHVEHATAVKQCAQHIPPAASLPFQPCPLRPANTCMEHAYPVELAPNSVSLDASTV